MFKTTPACYDYLEFYVDGSLQERISGSVDWQQVMYSLSMSSTLEWRYAKDDTVSSGSDCGWVDKVGGLQVNVKIDEKVFDFKIPEGFDEPEIMPLKKKGGQK